MEKYDLVIIGAGPAGLTSAIYAARYMLKVLVIGKLPGGLTGTAHEVCNYPSYGRIKGMELMMKMIDQVKKLNVEIKNETVEEIKKDFEITTNKGKYSAKKIILGTGSERGRLGLEREKDFLGCGVSYCATCDSSFYKDQIVGVVGGSDAALTSALLLAKYSKKVYLLHRGEKFTKGEPAWIKAVEADKRIEIKFNSTVSRLMGYKRLKGVELENGDQLDLGGLFVEIGSTPNIKLAEMVGVKVEKGYIVVDKHQRTSVEGVFAAGDVTNNPLKQIVTACGEGAIAAKTAYDEISS